MTEEELYERCINLEHEKYDLMTKIEIIEDLLLHSHLTIEEMERIGGIINESSI